MAELRDSLLVAAAAFAVVALLTPAAERLAYRIRAVDMPGGRRVNTQPLPRLGGVALYLGLMLALGFAWLLPTFRPVFASTSGPLAFALAATAIFAVGLIDDLRGLSASAKLAGQIVAAGLLVLFGVFLRYVYIPGELGTVVLGTDLGALFTILAIVVMVNAVNLVDGLDGLAAGVVAIAAAALYIYVQISPAQVRPPGLATSPEMLLAALIGACLAFLLYNFHPARVIMGDSGAMLLGLVLGGAGIHAVGSTLVLPGGRDFAALSVPVLVPALVLAVPLADTLWAILRRLRSGRALFHPDKKHLHHRLLELGHSHRRAVLIVYAWSAVVAVLAVAVSALPLRTTGMLGGLGVLTVLVATLAGRRRERRPVEEGRPRL